MEQIQEGDFTPNIIYRGNEPVEYAVLPLTQFGPEYHSVEFENRIFHAVHLLFFPEIP